MSAAVLRDPRRKVQTIEDDRESAVHVLTWIALRYTKHDRLDNLRSDLAIFDELGGNNFITGGMMKGNDFASQVFPTFTSAPLNRILSALRETFSARYGRAYSAEEIKKVNDFVARAELDPAMDASIFYELLTRTYGSRMEALGRPKWLMEILDKHLKSDDWPSDDKAVANPIPVERNWVRIARYY